MAVAYDGGDAFDGGEFLRGALGVTACDEDAGFRVEAMGAADVGAGFAVGFGGDRAGVDDDDFGLRHGVRCESRCVETLGDGFAVSAG